MKYADTEAAVQAGCLQLLAHRGVPAWRTDAATRPGATGRLPAGWPDITAILPGGVFLGIECKRPPGPRCRRGGHLRLVQIELGLQIQQAGGYYLVIDDVAVLARWLDVILDPADPRPAGIASPPAFVRSERL